MQQTPAKTFHPLQVAIHDCVRDTVKFGFNAWWDNSPPDTTLRAGYGHCNPKGALFVAMLGAAGKVLAPAFTASFQAVSVASIGASRPIE